LRMIFSALPSPAELRGVNGNASDAGHVQKSRLPGQSGS
jgi:hypothetical protein